MRKQWSKGVKRMNMNCEEDMWIGERFAWEGARERYTKCYGYYIKPIGGVPLEHYVSLNNKVVICCYTFLEIPLCVE